MPIFRCALLILTLLLFFSIGVPVQALLARYQPRRANRIPILFCRMILRLLRMKVEIVGPFAETGPRLLAVNHVSWIDIPVLASLTPFCFLAKKEVASWPILSSLANVQGTVFIDRSRRRGIPPANRDMASRMRSGRPVLLFPEGTTFDGRTLGPFYSSHFAAARDYLKLDGADDAVVVQPVALAYSDGVAAWIGDDALVPHLWRILRHPPLTCRVIFAPPLSYRQASDRKIVAQSARRAIQDALDATRSNARQAAPESVI